MEYTHWPSLQQGGIETRFSVPILQIGDVCHIYTDPWIPILDYCSRVGTLIRYITS